jgi:transposase
MTSPAGPRRWAARSGAGGILASSWDRRARTWPGARTRIAQCRVSRGGRARAARTWPTQLCGAHLLRDIEDAAQSYPGAIWPGQIADALRALIHAANLAREQPLAAVPDADAAPHRRLFRHGVRVGLSQVPGLPGANVEQPPARLLLECLRDREDDVLRFLSDLRIPPTSNQAERDVRPANTQQKISGRLRSEQATRHRYAIPGYISTAAKHRISVFTALRDALTSNPWMPPVGAQA